MIVDTAPVIPSLTDLPVVQTTLVLKPHHSGAIFNCVSCQKPVARWSIKHPRYGAETVDICALCFLYTSGWLVGERTRRVQQVIQVISLKHKKVLEVVPGSVPQLVNVKDADNVLGAIAIHDRNERTMALIQQQRRA